MDVTKFIVVTIGVVLFTFVAGVCFVTLRMLTKNEIENEDLLHLKLETLDFKENKSVKIEEDDEDT